MANCKVSICGLDACWAFFRGSITSRSGDNSLDSEVLTDNPPEAQFTASPFLTRHSVVPGGEHGGDERPAMIIVLKPQTTPEQVQHVLKRIEALGLTPHLSQGVARTIIGVIGDEEKLQVQPLQAIPGVEQVVPILKPYKLASREFHRDDSVVEVKGVRIGGGYLGMIAGPCAIESESLLLEVGARVKEAGANILRGGAFKPRTSPYSFQGLGEQGLKILQTVGEQLGMPVVTEVMDPRQVDFVERYADMLQVGARNMQNFDLLKEVGRSRLPVLLKRGMSATVKDLLMSAEYILAQGNRQVILCERGIRTFEDSTRNTLDLSIVPNVKGLSHLPIIVDPSHATGRPDLIPAMARAAVAAGSDGVHIEVHSCPEKALSDGPQALLPEQYARLMDDLRQLAELVGKSIDIPEGETVSCATLLIAGNWKLNPTTAEAAVALAEGVKSGLGTATDVHVAICPPFVFLNRIDQVLEGSPVGLGAQDMFWEASGAYTGEVSGGMLVDVGCTHVILGHSERRHGLGETMPRSTRSSRPHLRPSSFPSSVSARPRMSGWPSGPRP